MIALVLAILVSAALIKGGDNGTDQFIARQAWLYVSILGAGYFISRGLAKSGSREPYTDEPSDRSIAPPNSLVYGRPGGQPDYCPPLGRETMPPARY